MPKTVRFPVYFEVVGYRELEIPDYIDPDDEYAVREFIDDSWDHVPLPDDYEYVGGCVFDWDAPIHVLDR